VSQSSRPPPQKPNFRWIKKFCDEYEPISYTIAGILCSGALYTMTARTGVGKTAWLISTALAIVTGRSDILGSEVEKGRVAFCTAENPTDLRMRFNVNAYHWRIDLDELANNLIVSDNRVRPEDIVHCLAAEGGAFALVIIDTWQGFFDGKDPNNNAEAIEFTKRFRPLARLPARPPSL
jgi:RecA-family ATPase